MNKIIFLLLISYCLVNCQTEEFQCPKVKPAGSVMCPMIYSPVCAILKDQTKKEFSNSCMACSNQEVVSYIKGKCTQQLENQQSQAQQQNQKCPKERSKICPKIYKPVCGYFNQQIQCIKAPCANDYGNYCEACADPNVDYYISGKCETFENSHPNQDQQVKKGGFKILQVKTDSYVCPEQRPEICTLEYSPHCGFFNQNIQCIKAPCGKTYGNQCSACSDPNVAYVKQGDCSQYANLQQNQDTQSGYQITVKIAMILIIAALALFL